MSHKNLGQMEQIRLFHQYCQCQGKCFLHFFAILDQKWNCKQTADLRIILLIIYLLGQLDHLPNNCPRRVQTVHHQILQVQLHQLQILQNEKCLPLLKTGPHPHCQVDHLGHHHLVHRQVYPRGHQVHHLQDPLRHYPDVKINTLEDAFILLIQTWKQKQTISKQICKKFCDKFGLYIYCYLF